MRHARSTINIYGAYVPDVPMGDGAQYPLSLRRNGKSHYGNITFYFGATNIPVYGT